MTEFPQLDSGLVVPVFTQGDDPIACLNKEMAFLSAVATSRFPSTNNQLRTFSNPRNQDTIQDVRVTVQQVQERVVKCYNCQGEGHMARQCTQPKRPGNAAWFKDKAMLAEAQESGQILNEEQLAFLIDPSIPDGQAAQTTIPNNAAFQTEDLDAYDSDCDDVSNAHVVLKANLSNYGSDVILEVPHFEPYHNDMDNQSVHVMQDFEQTPVVDFPDNEITSDSNIISYS
ncbi:putative ribonuclease H-like domain-containing protein [Tanacetum coccineum]